jgi:hypothetical protein
MAHDPETQPSFDTEKSSYNINHFFVELACGDFT